MAAWAMEHWFLTFLLVLAALGVLDTWGKAIRKRERIVRFEPPPPLQSNLTIEQVCPRCRGEGPLEKTLREIQDKRN